jgi:hypothetical protein
MKKLFFAILFIATSFTAISQTPSLNKQQTLDYINELFIKAIDDPKNAKHFSLKYVDLEMPLNGKLLRLNLTKVKEITLEDKTPKGYGYYVYCEFIDPSIKYIIFYDIVNEADAKRLKKAFEHLVELVKKEGDPFGN